MDNGQLRMFAIAAPGGAGRGSCCHIPCLDCFGRDGLPVVREGRAATQPCPTEYRSVTLGNGDVLRRTAIFLGIARGWRPSPSRGGASRAALTDKEVSDETPVLLSKAGCREIQSD